MRPICWDIASALARMVQGDEPLLLAADIDRKRRKRDGERPRPVPMEEEPRKAPSREKDPGPVPEGMERFRMAVGYEHGVKPGNIVGAIANEAELDSALIGRIEIYDGHSTIDLPEGMPRDLFRALKKVWVCGQRLQISRLDGDKKHRGKKGSKGGGPKKTRKKDRHRKGKK